MTPSRLASQPPDPGKFESAFRRGQCVRSHSESPERRQSRYSFMIWPICRRQRRIRSVRSRGKQFADVHFTALVGAIPKELSRRERERWEQERSSDFVIPDVRAIAETASAELLHPSKPWKWPSAVRKEVGVTSVERLAIGLRALRWDSRARIAAINRGFAFPVPEAAGSVFSGVHASRKRVQ